MTPEREPTRGAHPGGRVARPLSAGREDRPRRRSSAGRVPTPLVLFLLALLGGLAYVQATLLAPVFLERRDGGERIPELNLPAMTVRVFAAGGDTSFLLKTPFDLPAADESHGRALNEALFGDHIRRRYYLLHATRAGEGEVLVAPADGPVLIGADGRSFRPIDLTAAAARRADVLPRFLAAWLAMVLPASGPVRLAPGESAQILFAYDGAAAPETIARVEFRGIELKPAEFTKDDLDRRLEEMAGTPAARRNP